MQTTTPNPSAAIPAPQTPAGRLIEEALYLDRFDRSPRLLAVQTFQTASNERFTRTVVVPWKGL